MHPRTDLPGLLRQVAGSLHDHGTKVLVLDDITRLRMHRVDDQDTLDLIRAFMNMRAIIQPRAGRNLGESRLTTQGGITVGLDSAMLPGLMGMLSAAALIGAGTALITPLGFAALASSAPQERLGQTMGAAELGREPGDAGGRCWSRSSPR
ncbi:hypothetical protein ACIREM_16970 [Streptomyces shenzhenensis]|uniref:hypothetical protein n=1 Tax=Streptomyces shenzhenensis TaxID=943815 RepID=UPI00382DB18B